MKNNIDLGVSLYGFTQRFVEEDEYGFEEMFQDLNRLGVKKFEIVGAQMFSHYPNPTDEEIAEVIGLAKKYDVQPFSYGGCVDFAKLPDRDMDDDEIMNEVVFDLMTAHKLGCEYIRGFGIPVRLYERVAQMAAFYGVKVCYEIHAPERPSDPHIRELVKLFEKLQSPWVGFVPDLGCYSEEEFKEVLPYVKYFHGNFYHIEEDCVETAVPYQKLLESVVKSGFEGTIMIEYEGYSFYLNDAVEQIGRHIKIEKKILEEV